MRYRWGIALLLILLLFAAASWKPDSAGLPLSEDALTTADLGLMLLEDADGVSVLAVREHSVAEHSGIRPGDTLMQEDALPFRTVQELEQQLLLCSDPTLSLHVQRADEYLTVLLVLQPAKR